MRDLSKIEKLRYILDKHQFLKIEGTTVDAVSANAMVRIYDALNEANKQIYITWPISKMVDFAWKHLKTKEEII